MEQHEFDIEIAPNGQVRVHIKGVKGQACVDYVRLFERILGRAAELQHTGEFYEPPTGVAISIEQKAQSL